MSENLRHWIFERYLPQNVRVRNERTKKNYRHAVNDLAELLGREPLLSDLNDETLTALIVHLLGTRKVAEVTANERAARIRTFWTWAARKRVVELWPTFSLVPVPEKVPRAWREAEMVKLFNACRASRGEIGGVPAWRWWFTIHGWLWCTAARIGETLALRVEHLSLDEAVAVVPASIRKGKMKAACYHLWPDLVEMLRMILPPHAPERELVWPWPLDITSFYGHYNRLLIRAGLPHDRTCKPQRMRVSHATWRHLAGDDATRALGHSSPETTRKSYLDPTICRPDERQLFRPW